MFHPRAAEAADPGALSQLSVDHCLDTEDAGDLLPGLATLCSLAPAARPRGMVARSGVEENLSDSQFRPEG